MDFCAKCGKPEIYQENLCQSCYREEHPQLEEFKEIKAVFCSNCNSYLSGHQWKRYETAENAIKNLVQSSVKSKAKINVFIPEHKKLPNRKVEIKIDLGINDEQYQTPGQIKFTLCPTCQVKTTAYFEAVLQMRNPTKEVLQFVEKEVAQQKNVFITKKSEVDRGFDYFLTKNNFARRLGEKLQNKFGGLLKTSAQLFTFEKQTGKKVYRLNVLFKLPSFKKDDLIEFKGEMLKVISVRKDLHVINLSTKEKRHLPFEELEDKGLL